MVKCCEKFYVSKFYFKRWLVLLRKASFKQKCKIFYSIYQVLAALSHELFHIMMALLINATISSIKCNHFCKIEGYTLKTFEFEVATIGANKLITDIKFLLVNIAPLFIFIIIPFLPWPLIIYLLTSYKALLLSEVDKKSIRKNIAFINAHIMGFTKIIT